MSTNPLQVGGQPAVYVLAINDELLLTLPPIKSPQLGTQSCSPVLKLWA